MPFSRGLSLQFYSRDGERVTGEPRHISSAVRFPDHNRGYDPVLSLDGIRRDALDTIQLEKRQPKKRKPWTYAGDVLIDGKRYKKGYGRIQIELGVPAPIVDKMMELLTIYTMRRFNKSADGMPINTVTPQKFLTGEAFSSADSAKLGLQKILNDDGSWTGAFEQSAMSEVEKKLRVAKDTKTVLRAIIDNDITGRFRFSPYSSGNASSTTNINAQSGGITQQGSDTILSSVLGTLTETGAAFVEGIAYTKLAAILGGPVAILALTAGKEFIGQYLAQNTLNRELSPEVIEHLFDAIEKNGGETSLSTSDITSDEWGGWFSGTKVTKLKDVLKDIRDNIKKTGEYSVDEINKQLTPFIDKLKANVSQRVPEARGGIAKTRPDPQQTPISTPAEEKKPALPNEPTSIPTDKELPNEGEPQFPGTQNYDNTKVTRQFKYKSGEIENIFTPDDSDLQLEIKKQYMRDVMDFIIDCDGGSTGDLKICNRVNEELFKTMSDPKNKVLVGQYLREFDSEIAHELLIRNNQLIEPKVLLWMVRNKAIISEGQLGDYLTESIAERLGYPGVAALFAIQPGRVKTGDQPGSPSLTMTGGNFNDNVQGWFNSWISYFANMSSYLDNPWSEKPGVGLQGFKKDDMQGRLSDAKDGISQSVNYGLQGFFRTINFLFDKPDNIQITHLTELLDRHLPGISEIVNQLSQGGVSNEQIEMSEHSGVIKEILKLSNYVTSNSLTLLYAALWTGVASVYGATWTHLLILGGTSLMKAGLATNAAQTIFAGGSQGLDKFLHSAYWENMVASHADRQMGKAARDLIADYQSIMCQHPKFKEVCDKLEGMKDKQLSYAITQALQLPFKTEIKDKKYIYDQMISDFHEFAQQNFVQIPVKFGPNETHGDGKKYFKLHSTDPHIAFGGNIPMNKLAFVQKSSNSDVKYIKDVSVEWHPRLGSGFLSVSSLELGKLDNLDNMHVLAPMQQKHSFNSVVLPDETLFFYEHLSTKTLDDYAPYLDDYKTPVYGSSADANEIDTFTFLNKHLEEHAPTKALMNSGYKFLDSYMSTGNRVVGILPNDDRIADFHYICKKLGIENGQVTYNSRDANTHILNAEKASPPLEALQYFNSLPQSLLIDKSKIIVDVKNSLIRQVVPSIWGSYGSDTVLYYQIPEQYSTREETVKFQLGAMRTQPKKMSFI